MELRLVVDIPEDDLIDFLYFEIQREYNEFFVRERLKENEKKKIESAHKSKKLSRGCRYQTSELGRSADERRNQTLR